MDTIEEISLSRIATIISNGLIIRTLNNTKWERILSNAGQSGLYTRYKNSITPDIFYYWNGQENRKDNVRFSEFYSAIKAILKIVYDRGQKPGAFAKLIGCIIEEIDIIDVLNEEKQKYLERRNSYDNPLEYLFKGRNDDECLEIIQKESKKEYHDLVYNLHILNLDIGYAEYQFVLKPFTQQGAIHLDRNSSLLMDWLEKEFPDVASSYKEALENYTKGNSVSCISSCRNIIVGIFEDSKEDETKWLKGLQKLSTDRYIEKVDKPGYILDNSANKKLGIENVKFKFSRFKTIYQLYSLSSDLGPHLNEGPKIDGVIYREKVTMNDTLWILRMTEDLLIWIKGEIKKK